MHHAWLLISPQRQTLRNCEVATVELIRAGDALEGKRAVARHDDRRLDHVVCSSLAAGLSDLPGVGWGDPDPGQEHVGHV
jgi:hypothetical protein